MKKLLAALLLSVVALTGCIADENRVINHTTASILRITGIVVAPTMFGPQEAEAVCTGFVVAPHKVLTAGHCIGRNQFADGLPASLIKKDEYFDLALLWVAKTEKKPLVLRSAPVRRYEELYGVGYGFGWTQPWGVKQVVMLTNVVVDPSNAAGIMVQGGGAGGMSGGPVVDERGQVVSINQQSNKGFGYGVSVTMIKAFLLDSGLELPDTTLVD